MIRQKQDYIIKPNPADPSTNASVTGFDMYGMEMSIPVIEERPLTIFLNNREIVTLMSVGDYPNLLAIGYLINQNIIQSNTLISAIDYDEEIDTVVIRTDQTTNFEEKLKRKILTSGCGMGTVFGDMMDQLEGITLTKGQSIKASWIEPLLKDIKATPSLYQKTGSIHGCVLCQGTSPLIYMEDVGRHNALDKIAGYMHLNQIKGTGYYLYTTGRMTSEMVIKAVTMNIPILISRSGATHWAVQLAKKANLTMISRARGKRFMTLSAHERIEFDLTPKSEAAE